MLPLLPFIAGIATGAVALKWWRTDKSALKLDQAQEKLRSATDTAQQKLRKATVSSLTAIEQSSAKMREKLTSPKASARPTPKASAQKAAVRKAVAKKAAPKKLAEPKPEATA